MRYIRKFKDPRSEKNRYYVFRNYVQKLFSIQDTIQHSFRSYKIKIISYFYCFSDNTNNIHHQTAVRIKLSPG